MTTQQKLQALLDRQTAKEAIRGALAAVQSTGGSLDAAAASGYGDAAESVRLTPETPYFLASITKMYTAVIVMHLVRGGQLDIEAPIGTYLPPELTDGIHVVDGVDRGAAVRVDQLLFQTSGLADYFAGKPSGGRSLEDELNTGLDRRLEIEDIAALVRSMKPHFLPGAKGGRRAHYSDTNYALLGAIIERVTGDSMGANLADRICGPLQLDNTFLFDPVRTRPAPAAIWHENQVVDIPLAMSSFPADGAMVATLGDSARFLRGFFAGDLLTADELAYLTRRWNRIFFPLQYGGGVMRFSLSKWLSPFRNPGELIGHSGSTGSFAFYSAPRDVVVVGTVNQSDNPGRPFRLMPQIFNLLR